jgi:hypothetical protein
MLTLSWRLFLAVYYSGGGHWWNTTPDMDIVRKVVFILDHGLSQSSVSGLRVVAMLPLIDF